MTGKNDSRAAAQDSPRGHCLTAVSKQESFMRHFLAVLSLGLTLAGTYSALAQPAPPPPHERATITVQGEGKSAAKPDYAAISADVVTTAPSLDAAQKAHRERAGKAAAALKAIDGLKIESSTFQLDRVSQPTPAGQKPVTEFRAVTSFALKTKNIAAIDEIVSKIAGTGLFEIHNLRFALDDDAKALDEARRNAVLDARHRAEIYAEAAGVKIGEVMEISDSERRFPMPMKQAGYARDKAVTPPDTLDVNASVTMTWRIRP
jgi:uncharacterized protein YggE